MPNSPSLSDDDGTASGTSIWSPDLAGIPVQKTAVVVVHGIGEQRPLDTLLGFVGDNSGERGLLFADDPIAYVNPDPISNTTYLRRLSVDARELTIELPENACPSAETRSVARVVDFYEYYWAYAFRTTKWRHLGDWLWTLLHGRRHDMAKGPGTPPSASVLRGTESTCVRRVLNIIVAGLLVLILATGLLAVRGWPASWWGAPGSVAAVLAFCIAVVCAMNPLGLIAIVRIGLAGVAVALLIALFGPADWSKLEVRQQISMCLGGALLLTVTVFYVWKRIHKPRASDSGIVTSQAETLVAEPTTPVAQPGTAQAQRPSAVLLVTALIAMAVIIWTLWSPLKPGAALIAAVAPVAIAVLASLTGGALLRGVGDAARYLSNGPDDVREREKIRTGLVEILRRLHERRDPVTRLHTYDRVIVVGHSLGSVIAFDAIQAYWTTVTPDIALPADPAPRADGAGGNAGTSSSAVDVDVDVAEIAAPIGEDQYPLAALEDFARLEVIEKLEGQLNSDVAQEDSDRLSAYSLPSVTSIDEWELAQRRFQTVLRYPSASSHTPHSVVADDDVEPKSDEKRWIITDFISAGCPLAHAELLLATGHEDLEKRKRRNLLPADPPAHAATGRNAGGGSPTLRWRVSSYSTPLERMTRMLSTSQFAAVVWTNLYFQHDLVGGPLQTMFGNGIRDIELPEANPYLLNFLFKYPHSSYWPGQSDRPGGPLEDGRPVGTKGSRMVFRHRILEPVALLWISGAAAGMSKFQTMLYRSAPIRTATGREGVELRLLLRADDDNAPLEWLWPGPYARVDAECAETLAKYAVSDCGLKAVLTRRE
jgi:hypothetical protein